MRTSFMWLALASALGIDGGAAAVAQGAPQGSLQQDFDAATAAQQAGKCAEAEPIFARLAVDPRVKPGSLPAAMVSLRRGLCHIAMHQENRGAEEVRQGLDRVEAAGPDLLPDAVEGHMMLARLALRRFDHDGTLAQLHHVLAMPGYADAAEPLALLAQATMFDGDGTALKTIDHALALVLAGPGGRDRNQAEARWRTLRARALMATGAYAAAAKDADRALSLAGGLTTNVTLSDVALRADAAEAALLNKQPDRARELLAYTGAGRIAQSPFASARVMRTPDCDEAAGLRPDDMAVVEFSIGDHGEVASAQTVFTRGNTQVANRFARAVDSWRWQPEELAKIPPFFRRLVRVELRCTQNGSLPGVLAPLRQRVIERGNRFLANDPDDNGTIGWLRAAAARREAAGDARAAGWLLIETVFLDPIRHADDLAQIDHGLALLGDADPAMRAMALAMRAIVDAAGGGHVAPVSGHSHGDAATVLAEAAARPEVAADPLAQNSLRLEAVSRRGTGAFDAEAAKVLQAVADDARLDAASPLRQVALLRLANIAARQGHRDQAEALFARTGLSAEQCSLVGDIPRLRNSNFDDAFPVDAQRMGFEGWVKLEFDIATDGRTVNPRALIAYPPFVFVDGAKTIINMARFDTSFRPGGKLACAARDETVNFNLPYMH